MKERFSSVLFLTQIANEYPPFLLPLLKQKTAVCSIWKSGSKLVLSYLIPTGFYVFHKWLKKSSQLEIAIKSSINSWLARAAAAHGSLILQSWGLWRLAAWPRSESLELVREKTPWLVSSLSPTWQPQNMWFLLWATVLVTVPLHSFSPFIESGALQYLPLNTQDSAKHIVQIHFYVSLKQLLLKSYY